MLLYGIYRSSDSEWENNNLIIRNWLYYNVY